MVTVSIQNAEPYRSLFIDWLEEQLREVFSNCVDREAMLISAVEALNNAAEHGNQNNPLKKIQIECFLQKDLVLLALTDEGPGFSTLGEDPLKVRGGQGGLGIIGANTDLVSFNKTANQIIMIKGASVLSEKRVVEGITISIINDAILFISPGGCATAGSEYSREINRILARLNTLGPFGSFLELSRVGPDNAVVLEKIITGLLNLGLDTLYVCNVKQEIDVSSGLLPMGLIREQVQVLNNFDELTTAMAILVEYRAEVGNRAAG